MDPLLSSTIDFERYLKESVQSASSVSPKSLRQQARMTQDGMGIAEVGIHSLLIIFLNFSSQIDLFDFRCKHRKNDKNHFMLLFIVINSY